MNTQAQRLNLIEKIFNDKIMTDFSPNGRKVLLALLINADSNLKIILNQTHLAHKLGVDKQTVSVILRKLVDNKLLSKTEIRSQFDLTPLIQKYAEVQ